jgi:hypothetical protein
MTVAALRVLGALILGRFSKEDVRARESADLYNTHSWLISLFAAIIEHHFNTISKKSRRVPLLFLASIENHRDWRDCSGSGFRQVKLPRLKMPPHKSYFDK